MINVFKLDSKDLAFIVVSLASFYTCAAPASRRCGARWDL